MLFCHILVGPTLGKVEMFEKNCILLFMENKACKRVPDEHISLVIVEPFKGQGNDILKELAQKTHVK